MNDLRREILAHRGREYTAALSQRRYVNDKLRDAYDMSTHFDGDEDFQVSLLTDELPRPLTSINERYYGEGKGLDELEKLFGCIAVDTTVHIDKLEPGYRISLLRVLTEPS
jgi:hypothetical protein